jgi:colanic acid/amylovoran biosynthesis glycosyltransferase
MGMPERKVMRVAVVTETFPKLSETFVVNHIRGLLDAGVEVDIYAFYGQSAEEPMHPVVAQYQLVQRTTYKPFEPLPKGVRFRAALRILRRYIWSFPFPICQSLNIFKYGKEALRLHRLFEAATFFNRQRYDVIHCHFGTTAEKLALFQEWGLLKAPLVTSFHGYELDDRQVVHPDMYHYLKNRGRCFIANSQYTRRRLLDFGFDERHIRIIPVSLDTRFFQRKGPAPDKPFHLLTVGRLVEFKGIEFSLRALALLWHRDGINFLYSIVGTGPLEAELQSILRELGIQSQVRMLGACTQVEIRDLMEQAHAFLLTGVRASDGRVENQGLVIQEAQSMELPVIVSNLGGAPEGMIDGETGFLVPERDVEAIARSVRILHDAPDLAGRMGRAGRLFVEGRYGIHESTKRIVVEYTKV